MYVDYCIVIVLCVYHVTWNVIIDTIVNVISEVWMWIVDRVVRLRQPGIASLTGFSKIILRNKTDSF